MGAELTSIEPLREVIQREPLGIFSDIDGTLAPIVRDPAKSKISPRAKELLTGLIACDVRIALVSGREIEAARRIVGLENVAYAGNHGLHVWLNGSEETSEAVLEYAGQARKVLDEIGTIPHAGVEIEDKGPVLAFHYRNAARQKFAREAIMAAIERAPGAAAFGVFEGRKVVELRPPLEINKGTAIVRLAERQGVLSAIAIGDDLTDVDMFRGVEELRRQGMAGATVAVWSAEAPAGLLEATDFWVRGVEGVEWLLDSALRVLRD